MRTALLALILAGSLPAGRPLDQLWSFVTSAWSASDGDEGLGFDPSGAPAGLGFDPNGAPPPETDAGLGFDPDGQPGS